MNARLRSRWQRRLERAQRRQLRAARRQSARPQNLLRSSSQGLPEEAQLRRYRNGRLVAGVCVGVAAHLGVPVVWVRAAFAALAAFGGAGVAAYGLLWVFVPQASGPQREASERERQQGFALLVIGIGLVAAVPALGVLPAWVTGPVGVVVVGAAVVWREADESQRRRWRQGARSGMAGVVLGGGGRAAVVRIMAGSALVVIGLGAYLAGTDTSSDMAFALWAVVATLVGVAVLTVPWWVRLVRDLNDERANRIRSEERAEIAAHLHDSVLQTLALIQKQAASEREVRRLARGQERELRHWLYNPDGYGRKAAADGAGRDSAPASVLQQTLSSRLAETCGEVEDAFAIEVSQVVVGDCPLDEALAAALASAREAVVNAAKHAGVGEVSVYAEVEADRVTIFVRDRGSGFDPEDVPEDRHGLEDSIRGRMERNGGTVRLKTAPGHGTEVQLEMPRS